MESIRIRPRNLVILPLSKLSPGMYPLRLEAFDADGARYTGREEMVIVPPPATGEADPAFRAFDDTLASYMIQRHIAGGALAVVKNGRIAYTRGYGWADADKQEPVQPTSLFRIASLSKSITALAVMKLVQEGRLDLDAKAFALTGLTPILAPGRQCGGHGTLCRLSGYRVRLAAEAAVPADAVRTSLI